MPFNTVNCPASTGSHKVTLDANTSGGFTVRGNGFRVAEFTFGGGEFHLSLPGSVPPSDQSGFHMDEDGHVAVTKE